MLQPAIKDISKPEVHNKHRRGKWHLWRRATQIIVLLLFLFLLFETGRELNTTVPLDLFFRLDPLVAISAMISSRSFILPLALSGATLLSALLIGRAWCGWLCPLGTVIDWIPSPQPKRKKPEIPAFWRQGKNLILFIIVLTAALGNLTLIFLDPITIMFRTFASVLVPMANVTVTAAEEWLYLIAALRPGLEWLDTLLRSTVLTQQPFYLLSLPVALLFAAVLALNAIHPRFWCRYLCPLGALLGLVAKVSMVRQTVDGEKCSRCGKCATKCPTAAINPETLSADPAECTACLDCADVCPEKAISFRGVPPFPILRHHQPEWRQFLIIRRRCRSRHCTPAASFSHKPASGIPGATSRHHR